MASRRDELNAYTFARRRTVGAFLRPAGGGNDEDAPRPIRAVMPSLVMSAVVIAGFGLWGLVKPAAPQGWDDGKSIVVGKDSTTRYVVLANPKDPQDKTLYPVLNMASAKLVLDTDSKVTFVEDSVLDKYPKHGPTIGIPYAPDKLPSADDAALAKKWSVCVRPGNGDQASTVNQAVFVAAGQEAAALEAPNRHLAQGQVLFVQGPDTQTTTPQGQTTTAPGIPYLVDAAGRKHQLDGGTESAALQTAIFGAGRKPEPVTQQWLDTLANGSPVQFPDISGFGEPSAGVKLATSQDNAVGRILAYDSNHDGKTDTHYVVGQDRLYLLTEFQTQLLLGDPRLEQIYNRQAPVPSQLSPADHTRFAPNDTKLKAPADWPSNNISGAVNNGDGGSARSVLCSTFEGMQGTLPMRSVWAGFDYPAPVNAGAASAHVSAGTGLLYRALEGSGSGSDGPSGTVFLLTEAGLRYAVVANGDSEAKSSVLPSDPPSTDPATQSQDQGNDAQARLGYKDIDPALVPRAWSDLVPAGPNLSTKSALQPQDS